MKNVIQESSREMDYTNATGSDIASGQLVLIGGGQVGVALDAIANGATGVLVVSDLVVTLPKVAGNALNIGTVPAVGTAGNTVDIATNTAATTMTNAFVWETAAADATEVKLALK
jgi:hypothetical protein